MDVCSPTVVCLRCGLLSCPCLCSFYMCGNAVCTLSQTAARRRGVAASPVRTKDTSGGQSGWMMERLHRHGHDRHTCGTTRLPRSVCHCTLQRSRPVVVCLRCGLLSCPCLCSFYVCGDVVHTVSDCGRARSRRRLLPSLKQRQCALPRTSFCSDLLERRLREVPSWTSLPSVLYEPNFHQVSHPGTSVLYRLPELVRARLLVRPDEALYIPGANANETHQLDSFVATRSRE